MKTFTYTARNAEGDVVQGTVKTSNFQHATESIRAKGLELISLEEMQQKVEELRTFVAETLDEDHHKAEEVILASNMETAQEVLQEDFGEELEKVMRKEDQVSESPEPEVESQSSESIIFSPAEKKPLWSRSFPHAQLERAQEELKGLSTRPGLSSELKQDLENILQKITLVKEHQNKKYWKDLRKEIKSKRKQVERFLEQQQDQSWNELQKQSAHLDSYSEFSEGVHQQREQEKQKMTTEPTIKKASSLMKMIQVLSDPNIHDEREVLLKQRYESLWIEMDRFMGALMVFYLCFFFVGYYLKRSGIPDNILVDIYTATLFKQITLGLFLFSAAIGIRNQFLPKKVSSDALIITIWLLSTWWIVM